IRYALRKRGLAYHSRDALEIIVKPERQVARMQHVHRRRHETCEYKLCNTKFTEFFSRFKRNIVKLLRPILDRAVGLVNRNAEGVDELMSFNPISKGSHFIW